MPRQGFRKQHYSQITRHAETVERQGNMRKLGAPFKVEHKKFFWKKRLFSVVFLCSVLLVFLHFLLSVY